MLRYGLPRVTSWALGQGWLHDHGLSALTRTKHCQHFDVYLFASWNTLIFVSTVKSSHMHARACVVVVVQTPSFDGTHVAAQPLSLSPRFHQNFIAQETCHVL